MRVAFITYGAFPVPATKGGAVENLIEDILEQNEVEGKLDFKVYSVYEKTAALKSKLYKNTSFIFVKVPSIINFLDRLIYWLAKNFLKKENLISYRYILRRIFVIKKYPKYLLKEDFDKIIFVTNSTIFLLLKNKKISSKFENRVVYYLHNEVRSFFGCEEKLKTIHSIIGISNFVNNALKKKYPFIDSNKMQVLKNCIDTNSFGNISDKNKQEYRKRFGISKNDFVVVFAGRIVKEKGVLEVIQAFSKIVVDNTKLLIVGSGFYSSDLVDPYTKKLKQATDAFIDKVIFTGYVPYSEMQYIYGMCDIAVMPSIWDEPAGMTMVEAVISGLPLITTVSGGIPEYITQKCAILLERDDTLVDNIANNIQKLMNDSELRKNMSVEGMRLAKVYNLKNYYNNFVELLTE